MTKETNNKKNWKGNLSVLIVFHNFSQFLLDIEMFQIHEFVFNIQLGYICNFQIKGRWLKRLVKIKIDKTLQIHNKLIPIFRSRADD